MVTKYRRRSNLNSVLRLQKNKNVNRGIENGVYKTNDSYIDNKKKSDSLLSMDKNFYDVHIVLNIIKSTRVIQMHKSIFSVKHGINNFIISCAGSLKSLCNIVCYG